MKNYRLWLICLVTLLLSACANKPSTQAWLTKDISINLPSAGLNQAYHDQQLLTFNYHDKQNSLITVVDANAQSLSVVGLSTLGIRLFNIEYRDNHIKTEQNIFIKELPSASQILSDIMLSIYPLEQWQSVLPTGWQLVDEKLHRKLLNPQRDVIIDITYLQPPSSQMRKPILIEHHIFGYQINIESME